MSKRKSEQFEEALKKLEGIVERMERGNLPLEEAMEAFTEGIRLVKFCHRKLEEAEDKIQVFMSAEGGNPTVAPFEPSPINDSSD